MENNALMLKLKESLYRSSLYALVQRRLAIKLLRPWTEADQHWFDFYSQFVPPNALIFDVGANIGTRTKVFLRMGATVVAVEPQPACATMLKYLARDSARLFVEQTALGESESRAEMQISYASTISSLSPDWIRSVKRSGRFAGYTWNKSIVVAVTTLDRLIARYGTPAFVKIDVEGFEDSVIKGLSQPIEQLSLEFTPEFNQSTINCIQHLQSLGSIRLNYSAAESLQMSFSEYQMPSTMIDFLSHIPHDGESFGDVYVQFC
jgi:FkbM family methyltransferase